jgi:hypothetical protein|tara:strand:- start:1326 stop:1679 length:354 start_codon:yes stop_codon:yes gene_type:complete
VEELAPFYDGQVFSPPIQEEFFNNGELDTKYVEYVLEQRTTENKLRTIVSSVFDAHVFQVAEVTNEVSKELFFKHYEFAKNANVREYIGFFNRAFDLLLTREALYDYILERENSSEA